MNKKMRVALCDWSSEQLKNIKKLISSKIIEPGEQQNYTLSKSSLLIKVDSAHHYIELLTNSADEFGIQASFRIQIDIDLSDKLCDLTVCCDAVEFIDFLEKGRKNVEDTVVVVTFPATDEKQQLLFSVTEIPVIEDPVKEITDQMELGFEPKNNKQNNNLLVTPKHTTPLHSPALITEFNVLIKHQSPVANIDSSAFTNHLNHLLVTTKGNNNDNKNHADSALQLKVTTKMRCIVYAISSTSIGFANHPLLSSKQVGKLGTSSCTIALTIAKKLAAVLCKKEELVGFIDIEIRDQSIVLYQGALTLCITIEKEKYSTGSFKDKFKLGQNMTQSLNVDDMVGLLETSGVKNGKHDVINFRVISSTNDGFDLCDVDLGYESASLAAISGKSHNQIETITPFEIGKDYAFNLNQFQNVIRALQNEPEATHEWYFNQDNTGLVLCQYYEGVNATKYRQFYMLALIQSE